MMMSPLVPDIAQGLGTGVREIGLAIGAYGMGVALAALAAAPRLGYWPKRDAIGIALAVLAGALVFSGLAWDWRILVLGQGLCGLAAGVIMPAIYSLTGDIAGAGGRTQAMGKVLAGWSLALVVGVPAAALLSTVIGWRGIFWVVATGALVMAAAGRLLPREMQNRDIGQVSYVDVLRVRGAVIGYAATVAYMIAFYQTYTFVGDHVRAVHGSGAWMGGAMAMVYGLGFGGGVVFDRWIDARGPGRVLPFALVAGGVNYIVLPFATQSAALTVLYPFLWGLSNHFSMTSLVAHLSSLSVARRGAIMGLFTFVTYLSLGAAGAIYGTVYDRYGFLPVSLAAAATMFAGAALLWRGGERKPDG